MFKTIDELKEFVLFAKANKIQSFQIGDVLLHFNHAAFIDPPNTTLTPDLVNDIIKQAQSFEMLEPRDVTDEELFGKEIK